jgi:hypothetical protein
MISSVPEDLSIWRARASHVQPAYPCVLLRVLGQEARAHGLPLS